MTTVKEALRGDAAGVHLGDVILPEFSGVEIRRSELAALFRKHGLPESLVTEDCSAQRALGKAVAQFKAASSSGLFFKRETKRGDNVLLVQQEGRKFTTLASVSVDATDQLAVDTVTSGGEGAIDKLQTLFNWHQQFADSAEMGELAVSVLMGWCSGIRLKSKGHAYWVQAVAAESVRALDAVVDAVPGSSDLGVLPVHNTSRGAQTVGRMARASFEQELSKLQERLDGFDEKTRTSTVENTADMLEDLRGKVGLYADVLDDVKGKLLQRLTEVEKVVVSKLEESESDDDWDM